MRLVVGVGDTAAEVGLAVQVALTLPGGEAGEMRRALGGDAPVSHAHAGVADHRGATVAPLLSGNPLDEVIAVLSVLRTPQVDVALGVAHAARIDVSDGIAVMAPVTGIGRLELGVLRNGFGRHAHELPRVHALGRVLTKRGKDADDRYLLGGVGRTVDVGVNRGAVAQDTGDVALAHDARDIGHVGMRIVFGAETHGSDHLAVTGRLGILAHAALDLVEFLATLAGVALSEGNLELLAVFAEGHLLIDALVLFFGHRKRSSRCVARKRFVPGCFHGLQYAARAVALHCSREQSSQPEAQMSGRK